MNAGIQIIDVDTSGSGTAECQVRTAAQSVVIVGPPRRWTILSEVVAMGSSDLGTEA